MSRAVAGFGAVRRNQTWIAVASVALCVFVRIKNNAQRLVLFFCKTVNQTVVSAYLHIVLWLPADVSGFHATIMADADEQQRNYKSDMSSRLSQFKRNIRLQK